MLALPQTSAQIAALIPHQGPMCLLSAVESCDAKNIVCWAQSHADANHPLHHQGQLSPLALIEYAAQATAVHGALLEGGRPGWLAGVRNVEFPTLASANLLRVQAQQLLSNAEGALYSVQVLADGAVLLRGRVSVMWRD